MISFCAMKRIRFDNLVSDSVRFLAKEILIQHRLDHRNVMKLQGLTTSRMSSRLYLIFDYMDHDPAGFFSSSYINLALSQVKCLMHQLLWQEHCYNCNVLYPDIKGANLLIDNKRGQKIDDFGLASIFDLNQNHLMTNRVVTLLIETLLGINLAERLTATAVLNNELFREKPYACHPSSLPEYPQSKEMDAKRRDEEATRLRNSGRDNYATTSKKTPDHDRVMPALEANAELQANIDKLRLATRSNAKCKSEKFPPIHKDGLLDYPSSSFHQIHPDFDIQFDELFVFKRFDKEFCPNRSLIWCSTLAKLKPNN